MTRTMRGWAGLALAVVMLASPAAGQASERVVGGAPAKPGAFPFMAYLLIAGQAQCGGTLVAKTFVLTAAHCTFDWNRRAWPAGAFDVRLGTIDGQAGGIKRRVRRVIIHERYDAEKVENDIALLELDSPVTLQPAAVEATAPQRGEPRFVRLSSSDPFGMVVGWGRTNPDPDSQVSLSRYLMAAPIPIVDTETCNAAMGGFSKGPIDARRICAGQSQGGIDACNGDSGGPLLAQNDNDEWVVVGITSWGVNRCGANRTYGVYTRVAAFSDWLKRNIAVVPAAAPPPASSPVVPLGSLAGAPAIVAAAAKEDGRVAIDLLPGARMKLGDAFKISIRSSFDGWLVLLDVDARGKITQIFPNLRSEKFGVSGRILAGAPLVLPDASYAFDLRAAEPLGRGRLIAVVAKNRETFGGLIDRGVDHIERLEAVLKPTVVPVSAALASENDVPWAAGQRDYIVELVK